jgi:hypothetical protein
MGGSSHQNYLRGAERSPNFVDTFTGPFTGMHNTPLTGLFHEAFSIISLEPLIYSPTFSFTSSMAAFNEKKK